MILQQGRLDFASSSEEGGTSLNSTGRISIEYRYRGALRLSLRFRSIGGMFRPPSYRPGHQQDAMEQETRSAHQESNALRLLVFHHRREVEHSGGSKEVIRLSHASVMAYDEKGGGY